MESCFPPSQDKIFMCPVHADCPLEQHEARNGWEYLCCPVETEEGHRSCFIITSVDKADSYLKVVSETPKVMELYGPQCDKIRCYCEFPLSLNVSGSEKNPGRPYFKCRRNNCNFFQWADNVSMFLNSTHRAYVLIK